MITQIMDDSDRFCLNGAHADALTIGVAGIHFRPGFRRNLAECQSLCSLALVTAHYLRDMASRPSCEMIINSSPS